MTKEKIISVVKKYLNYIFISGLIILVLILLFNLFQQKKEYENALEIQKIQSYAKESGYKFYISRTNDTIRGMEQMIVSQKQAIEMGLLEKKELKDKYIKKVQSETKLKEEIRILSKTGQYIGKVEKESNDFDTIDWVQLPLTMEFEDSYYSLFVTAGHSMPVIDSLLVLSEPKITLGIRKEGLFKKKEKVALYENSNPYISLKTIESLTIQEEKKWYQTDAAKIGLGVVVGITIVGLVQ